MAMAVGTTEVLCKVIASRCAADPGSARVGGVCFCGHAFLGLVGNFDKVWCAAPSHASLTKSGVLRHRTPKVLC
jgi:hypothetical protein